MNSIKMQIIRKALWNTDEGLIKADWDTYSELKQHAILSLTTPILSIISMPSDLYSIWKQEILLQVSNNIKYKYEQSNLPLNVQYVILKGASAAQYYSYPEYRSMGDIDIMPRREDFDQAYQQLIDNRYQLISTSEREISFRKNGFTIELHRYFASLNDPKKAEFLDDLILDNITATHILPDMINGLVLLEHISQHLEHGLGLRQIIDWMMFVDKCLSDEKWTEFSILAKKIGMEKLAIITTHMCEIYLGLSERNWCKDADEPLCSSLMEYILSCGNFGNKWADESKTVQTVLTYTRGPIATIKWLQERGLVNWKAAQKYAFLRHFAWIYQAGRYSLKGVKRNDSFTAIKMEYSEAKKRMALFDALGVKQKAKGLVGFRKGRYVKI